MKKAQKTTGEKNSRPHSKFVVSSWMMATTLLSILVMFGDRDLLQLARRLIVTKSTIRSSLHPRQRRDQRLQLGRRSCSTTMTMTRLTMLEAMLNKLGAEQKRKEIMGEEEKRTRNIFYRIMVSYEMFLIQCTAATKVQSRRCKVFLVLPRSHS